MTVLEHRAYAFGMQGLLEEAVKDAQNMIALAPAISTGYFQLGNIYRMQGKQLSAIKAYDTGLKIVPTSHPYHDQMMKNRELATERSKSRIDFVARLPVEIVDSIISLLPSEAKSISLTVSSVWRNKILKCSDTWKTLTCGSEKDDWATALIPHIGTHVEDLTINTTDRRVFLRYLHCMNAGDFDKLKALKLADLELKNVNNLAFRGDDSGIIQPLLLRSILSCSTLTHVAASASRDIPGLVNTLAVLPQLEFLEISHDHRTAAGEPDLIQLFKQYSNESRSKQRLKVIWLRYCKTIVTDNVLNALASIHTLEEIAFEGLSNVSTLAVDNVFKKLGKSVSEVRLTEMNIITDSSLLVIGKNLTGLKRIHLEKLKTVTDRGVKYLVEKAPNLESLALIKCESVTPKGISQAKKLTKGAVVVG
ncbi:hypothetical protein BJV82DRAFT_573575 [Fennellomyces sp. T-0311]|nr:hypothetical protein BJV82DRAFT_573575 [Fennellomyces sp. T-0311]